MSSYRFLARAGVAIAAVVLLVVLGGQIGTSRANASSTAAIPRAGARAPAQTPDGPLTPHATVAPLRVFVIGASVSRGWGASSTRKDYTADLARLIEQKNRRPVSMIIDSVPGAAIAADRTWMIPTNQDIVITQLITNDFILGTPLLQYQQSVDQLLNQVRATSPKASLLCLGAWEPEFSVNRAGIPATAYNSLDQHACKSAHGTFLSLSPIYQVAKFHGPVGRPTAFGRGDRFHPNNQGHARIAAAVYAALAKTNAFQKANTGPVQEDVQTAWPAPQPTGVQAQATSGQSG
ncbi:MAG: SGNH/GDSL hydrolase family protein [Candidatus Dormiibacterota bacterium]